MPRFELSFTLRFEHRGSTINCHTLHSNSPNLQDPHQILFRFQINGNHWYQRINGSQQCRDLTCPVFNSGEEFHARILRGMRQLVYGSRFCFPFLLSRRLPNPCHSGPSIWGLYHNHWSNLCMTSALVLTIGSSFRPSLVVLPDFFSSAKHRSPPPVIYPRLALHNFSLVCHFFIHPQWALLTNFPSCNSMDLRFYTKHILAPSFTTESDNQ